MKSALNQVLVYLDLNDGDTAVFRMLDVLRRRVKIEKLVFLHASPLRQKLSWRDAEGTLAELGKDLEARLHKTVEEGVGPLTAVSHECVLLEGSTFNSLIHFTHQRTPDLLLLRRGKPGSERASLARRLAPQVSCPILVTTGRSTPTMSKMLVPSDLSAAASATLRQAVGFATRMDLDQVTVLNVAPSFQGFPGLGIPYARMETDLRKFQESRLAAFIEAQGEMDLRLRPRAIFGDDIAAAIRQTVDRNRFDWIVMGTRGTNSLRTLFLGSTTEAVLDASTVPVMIVPQAIEAPAG